MDKQTTDKVWSLVRGRLQDRLRYWKALSGTLMREPEGQAILDSLGSEVAEDVSAFLSGPESGMRLIAKGDAHAAAALLRDHSGVDEKTRALVDRLFDAYHGNSVVSYGGRHGLCRRWGSGR